MRVIVLLCWSSTSGSFGERRQTVFPLAAILDVVRLPNGYAEVNGALEREYRFRDFAEALAFVNRVGELAEREGHHPDVEIHWNRVKLRWWTHVRDAITERDYELAEETNRLV
jgi:4a-hydroxytetrahydrobiopterin dehydratase